MVRRSTWIAFMLACVALAACSGGGDAGTGTGGGQPVPAKPGDPVGRFEGAQLAVSRWAGDPWEKATNDLAARWGQATGGSATVDAIPYETLHEKQVLELSSKTGTFDILYVHPSWFGEYAKAGYLRPIDDYLADPAKNPQGFSKDQYVPNILEQGAYEGKQYCVQDFTATVLLAYRKDVFEANGIAEPKTWDDVLAAAERLNGRDGMAGLALPGKRGGAVADVLSTLMVGAGTWYFDDAAKPSLDQAVAAKALGFYAEAAKYAPEGMLNQHWDEAVTAAAQGKAAQLITLSTTLAWLDDPARSKTVGKWGYVPLSATADKPAGELIYWNWCIAADSEQPEAAYSFLQWMTDTKQQAEVATVAATGGATKEFFEDQELASKLPFLAAMRTALENSKPQPSLAEWPKIQDKVELAVQDTISGKQSPDQAAGAIQAALTETLG
jgi:multiple sugar transport system substrate-binding protein